MAVIFFLYIGGILGESVEWQQTKKVLKMALIYTIKKKIWA